MLPQLNPQSDFNSPRIFRLFDPSTTIEQSTSPPPSPPRKKKKRKRVELRKVYERYQKPAAIAAEVSSKHLKDIELHLSVWESFWQHYRASTPAEQRIRYPLLPGVKREHLEMFRRHLQSTGLGSRTCNKYLGSIRSIMVTAENHALLKLRPRLERLPESPAAGTKIYFRDSQIDALMRSSAFATWPSKRATGVEPAVFWQAAIVLYRSYGFRVQELLAYEREKTPLTWKAITFDAETPNPESEETNDLGWLSYTPPKTRRFKSDPIYLPLTRYTRLALDLMSEGKTKDEGLIFRMPRAQESFFDEWHALLSRGKVKAKTGQFNPKHFRKSCATGLSRHKAGLATAVCRWGSSKNDSAEAKVALDHYIQEDSILMELHSVPWPESFEEFAIAAENLLRP